MTPSARHHCALASMLVAATSLAAWVVPAVALERSEVPAKYRWDLTALYPSEAAWTKARVDLEQRLPQVARYQGHLGAAADSLAAALETMMAVSRDLARLTTYASQLADEDARDSHHLEMRDAAERLGVQFRSTAAYVRPEILSVGEARVRAFAARNPRLRDYRHYLDDILRYAPHTLSANEEKIVAQAGRMANAGNSIHDLFNNAELPWPTITLSTGERVRLDDAAYT